MKFQSDWPATRRTTTSACSRCMVTKLNDVSTDWNCNVITRRKLFISKRDVTCLIERWTKHLNSYLAGSVTNVAIIGAGRKPSEVLIRKFHLNLIEFHRFYREFYLSWSSQSASSMRVTWPIFLLLHLDKMTRHLIPDYFSAWKWHFSGWAAPSRWRSGG